MALGGSGGAIRTASKIASGTLSVENHAGDPPSRKSRRRPALCVRGYREWGGILEEEVDSFLDHDLAEAERAAKREFRIARRLAAAPARP